MTVGKAADHDQIHLLEQEPWIRTDSELVVQKGKTTQCNAWMEIVAMNRLRNLMVRNTSTHVSQNWPEKR